MKVKIVSDGTEVGTKVIDCDTGEAIENVYSAVWECDIDNVRLARLTLKIRPVEIEAVGDVEMELQERTQFGDESRRYRMGPKKSG